MPTTPCCRRLTGHSRICAGNWPTPSRASPNAKKSCASSPPAPAHLDGPRASLRVLCSVQPAPDHPLLQSLKVRLNLFRPRTGEKIRPVAEIIDLTNRATHEQELFSPPDWEFIQWLAEVYADRGEESESLTLCGLD